MLTPENKATWVAALRSGDYKQYRHGLCNSQKVNDLTNATEFCCIGVGVVACGVDLVGFGTYGAAEALGLECGQSITLAGMNDVKLMSFHEIADYIEVNL